MKKHFIFLFIAFISSVMFSKTLDTYSKTVEKFMQYGQYVKYSFTDNLTSSEIVVYYPKTAIRDLRITEKGITIILIEGSGVLEFQSKNTTVGLDENNNIIITKDY